MPVEYQIGCFGVPVGLCDRTGNDGFSGLKSLAGLPDDTEKSTATSRSCVEIVPEERVADDDGVFQLYRSRFFSTFRDVRRDRILIAVHGAETTTPHEKRQIYLWKRIMTAMMTYAVLHGGNAFPVHAALLETPKGGVLLVGESGIGKTTSARRWRESGGVCLADDAVLLTRKTNGSFTAAPLPTWSRCEKSLAGCFFPITRELPLAGVLALKRTEKGKEEKIEKIPSSHFAAQIFRALFFPLLLPCRNLPDFEQKIFRDALWNTTCFLTRLFPPRALYAALDGNLRNTLDFYL